MIKNILFWIEINSIITLELLILKGLFFGKKNNSISFIRLKSDVHHIKNKNLKIKKAK